MTSNSVASRLFRRSAVTLVAVCSLTSRARAQDGGSALGIGIGVGYVALSVASLIRLGESGVAGRIGDSVRVTPAAPRSPRLQGRLTAVNADSLTLVEDSVSRRLARGEVREIQSYAGVEQQWAKGWAIGFVSGGAFGAVSGFAMGNDPPSDWLSLSAKEKAVLLGGVGAVAGSAVGALIGLAIPADHWRTINKLPVGMTAIVAPTSPGRLNVGVRVPF